MKSKAVRAGAAAGQRTESSQSAGASAFMTQKEYAAHQGVGQSAVSNWKKDGLLVFGGDAKTSRLVDVAATDRALADRRDPTLGRPAGGDAVQPQASGGNSLQVVRTELIQAQTHGKRMENARLAGDLVPLQEYQRRASELGRMIRERLKAGFRQEADRLQVADDRRTVMAICDETIDRELAQLADEVESGALADDADEEDDDAPVENEAEA